jgi:PEP-CTERM motif
MFRFNSFKSMAATFIATTTLIISAASTANASLLFDLSPGNESTYREANHGVGQGISVGTTTVLSSFSMFFNMTNGGNVKFMIWNGANTSLLYSETDTIVANSSMAWHSTQSLGGFTLNAGSDYYFGVIADGNINVEYIYPPVPTSQNGLTSINRSNSNYSSFTDPAFTESGNANISLQLYDSQNVPEPASLALLGLGLAGLTAARRKQA